MGTETMGTIIAKLRKEKGATQDELATCVGVSPQAVSKWENGKAFTIGLLVNHLGIDADTALNIIKTLCKYSLIETTLIEVDDIVQEVYTFMPTPSFTAMLIFAREMIDHPNSFSYYIGGRSKPYL